MEKEFQCLNYETQTEPPSILRLKEQEETQRISTMRCNQHKNRYKDVLPSGFDGEGSTRVCLAPIVGLEGSDFINANLLELDEERNYISCQAPVPHTIGDFWRMIWEQDSSVIVMLTRLVENDRVKAHAYWPSTIGKTLIYGFFSVTLTQERTEEENGIIVRDLQLSRLEDGLTRMITQLHFCDWPDNGAPRTCVSTCRLLQFYRIFKNLHKKEQGSVSR
jgi:protein tyrosine phosphatase